MTEEFEQSLLRQAAAQAAVANPGTRSATRSIVTEFLQWLAARGQARGVSAQTCRPVDVAVSRRRRRQQALQGSSIPRLSYCRAASSHVPQFRPKFRDFPPPGRAHATPQPLLVCRMHSGSEGRAMGARRGFVGPGRRRSAAAADPQMGAEQMGENESASTWPPCRQL